MGKFSHTYGGNLTQIEGLVQGKCDSRPSSQLVGASTNILVCKNLPFYNAGFWRPTWCKLNISAEYDKLPTQLYAVLIAILARHVHVHGLSGTKWIRKLHFS